MRVAVVATVSFAALSGCTSAEVVDVPVAPDASDASSDAPALLDADAIVETTASGDSATDAADATETDPRDGPGTFAAVGNRVRHVRSLDDGLTWIDDRTEISSSLGGDAVGIRTVVWAHEKFVAFAAKVFTSPDGKTWTEIAKADGQWMASMLYAQGQYVSSGGYGWLATTVSDLGKWEQHPPRADYTTAHHSRAALAFGHVAGVASYVVVDDDGNIFHANDGKTWLPSSGTPAVPAGATWGTTFAYGAGVFVGLLPSGAALVRSVDGGATWSAAGPLATAAVGLVYAQGHFTAVGAGHVYTSVDGASWTDHVSATARGGDVAYGHGTYLTLSGDNIFRSIDGITWTLVFENKGNPDPVASIAFGPK